MFWSQFIEFSLENPEEPIFPVALILCELFEYDLISADDAYLQA